MVRHIREDLGNRSIQIVLVTGHPGYVAQREVVAAYEIDGFRLKSELTPDNIFAAVYAALRTSRAMRDLEQQRDILREQQEALLRWKHIFEHAEWGIVIGSANGAHIEFANPAFARQHGYSPEELIGLPMASLFAPEEREQLLSYISTNDELSHQTFESRHLRKDGSTFPVLIGITAWKGDLGQVAYLVANVQDITEHKQAEAALKHRQDMLERTESIAHVGSWEWDAATDTTTWSDELFRIFQRDPTEGAPSFAEHPALYSPEDMRRLQDAVSTALNQGTPYELELCAIRRDGATRVCLARGHVERDVAKQVTRLFGSLQDITERKASEQALLESEHRFREMYQRAPLPYQSLDIEGNILDVNEEWLTQFGYTRPEVIGRFIGDLITAESIPTLSCEFQKFKESGRVDGPLFEFKCKDGSLKFMEVNGRIGRDNAGNFQRTHCILTDVTLRNQLTTMLKQQHQHLEELVEERTAELHNTETKYRTVADFTYDWETWIDDAGQWLYCSPACERVTGYRAEEFLARPELYVDIAHEDDRAGLLAHLHVGEHNGVGDIEYRIHHKNGELRWIEHLCQRVCDATGKSLGRRVSNRDITARKHADAALRQARDEAETANRAKSTFLANMSHEIRTPMNAVIGFTHMLRRKITEPEHLDKLGKIAAAADHLLGVINDILDISKIEADKLVLEQVNFEVEAVLGRISSMVLDQVQHKGLELLIDIPSDLGPVSGDATRLGQALLNYLGNAVKFTEHGTITLRARVLEESSTELLLRFEVQDSGIGIAAEHMPRLFHAFEQADNSTTRRFGGTGLGLAISRRIALLMGGEAGVESTPGVGSTFWLTARLERVRAEGGRYLIPELQGRRALVIDDTPVTQLVQSQLLRMMGFHSECAASGKAGLALLGAAEQAGKPFDLVLIDLLMPEMDGFETLADLRFMFLRHPPLVWLVTASGDPAILEDAHKVAFDEVLLKPLTASGLHGTLKKHLADKHGLWSALAPAAAPAPPPALATEKAEIVLRRDFQTARLLLVEDDPVNREVALIVLGEIGWPVDIAADGREAVEKATATTYDLILMDMQMPRMGGVEASKLIRQLPQGQQVPILAMTANAFADDRKACFDAGMNDFITKPVVPEKLYGVLLAWLASTKAEAPK